VTLEAYDEITRCALATGLNRKTVLSNAIVAYCQEKKARKYRLYPAAAFIAGIALGWLAFGAGP